MSLNKRYASSLATGLAMVLVQGTATAASIEAGNTRLTLGGYIKLDAMVTAYDARPGASLEPLGRDYYAGPRSVPLDDGSGSIKVTDFHAKQTRFFIKTQTQLDNAVTLGSYLELDFQNSSQGNETISNSAAPRLRQAYLTYGNWLFGQTWSTFQNVGALPETLDFIGPTESTIFIRQPMLRYSAGGLQVALENPETRVDSTTDDDVIPDIVLRWNGGAGSLKWSAAGLLRVLESQDGDAGADDSAVAGGISLSAKWLLQRDDVKFMVTAGSGLGRYLGVIANLDGTVDANGEIDPIDSWAGFVAYRHHWGDTTRSSIVLGHFNGDGDIARASSVHVNFLYSPVKNLTTGLELMHAMRENADGAEGAFTRLQFSAKLAF